MHPRVKLLSHYVDKDGVYINEDKVEKIRNVPRPRTRKELLSFLVIASCYRRFINNITEILRQITKKTSEKVGFQWKHEMIKAFEELKEALCTSQLRQALHIIRRRI